MSKYILAGVAGYLMGMKHSWLCRHFCIAKMWKKARRMMRV